MSLVLGIDGGGTGCRAALATPAGEIVGRGKSGPANIRTDLTAARENIVDAARQVELTRRCFDDWNRLEEALFHGNLSLSKRAASR